MNFCWDIRVMRPGYIRNTGDLEWLAGLALCFEPEPFFYALHRRFAKGGILQCGSITRVGMKADFEHHGWHTRSIILTIVTSYHGLTCNIEVLVSCLHHNQLLHPEQNVVGEFHIVVAFTCAQGTVSFVNSLH